MSKKPPEYLWAAFEPHEQGGAPRVYASAMKTKGVKYVRADTAEARLKQAVEVIAALTSWFPDRPTPPQWELPAGTLGADDAIEAARQFIKEQTDADK